MTMKKESMTVDEASAINVRNHKLYILHTKVPQAIFDVVIFLITFVLFLLPFINLICVSVSSSRAVMSGEVYFLPIEPQFGAWEEVFKNAQLIHSMFFTIFLTVTYTVIALFMITLAAYPLSRKSLKGRNKFTIFFMITMYFSGGLIPGYLLIQSLHMIDTAWALILPGAFSVFNMLILKSFYQNIPDSFEESAKIDGANDFQVLFKIYLPLSLPAIATLALYFAVSRWGSFSDALYYLPTRKDLYPLQMMLQQIIATANDTDVSPQDQGLYGTVKILSESQKAANILFTVIPIIMVYPWLQKYFVKGITLGGIKG